jgi:hypothetical protein
MKPNCSVKVVDGTIIKSDIWGGSVMGDFLKGARWGAWFVLAGITAAGLWAIVH